MGKCSTVKTCVLFSSMFSFLIQFKLFKRAITLYCTVVQCWKTFWSSSPLSVTLKLFVQCWQYSTDENSSVPADSCFHIKFRISLQTAAGDLLFFLYVLTLMGRYVCGTAGFLLTHQPFIMVIIKLFIHLKKSTLILFRPNISFMHRCNF